MRHRCLFERRAVAADAYGNPTDGTWTTLTTVWGALRVERATERMDGGRMASPVAGVVTIRSSATARGITAADRVTVRGDVYAIRAVTNPDGREALLEVHVERGVAD
jgi:SPP1 family predicted phage head-tail adaptor